MTSRSESYRLLARARHSNRRLSSWARVGQMWFGRRASADCIAKLTDSGRGLPSSHIASRSRYHRICRKRASVRARASCSHKSPLIVPPRVESALKAHCASRYAAQRAWASSSSFLPSSSRSAVIPSITRDNSSSSLCQSSPAAPRRHLPVQDLRTGLVC